MPVKNWWRWRNFKQVDTHHEEVSFVFVFAMCWNSARQKYPESIIQDFEDFLILVNPPRMQYNTTVPSFTLSIEGHTHRIHNHLVCNGGVFVHHCLACPDQHQTQDSYITKTNSIKCPPTRGNQRTHLWSKQNTRGP